MATTGALCIRVVVYRHKGIIGIKVVGGKGRLKLRGICGSEELGSKSLTEHSCISRSSSLPGIMASRCTMHGLTSRNVCLSSSSWFCRYLLCSWRTESVSTRYTFQRRHTRFSIPTRIQSQAPYRSANTQHPVYPRPIEQHLQYSRRSRRRYSAYRDQQLRVAELGIHRCVRTRVARMYATPAS